MTEKAHPMAPQLVQQMVMQTENTKEHATACLMESQKVSLSVRRKALLMASQTDWPTDSLTATLTATLKEQRTGTLKARRTGLRTVMSMANPRAEAKEQPTATKMAQPTETSTER